MSEQGDSMRVYDTTNNAVTPCSLSKGAAFQGRWWENKIFWTQRPSRLERIKNLFRKGDEAR